MCVCVCVLIHTAYLIITCSFLWWCCCVACFVSYPSSSLMQNPPNGAFVSAPWHEGKKKQHFHDLWTVVVFCLINDPNGATGLSRMPFLSATHTLSKALSSLSSLIVIKVMRNVKGRNAGLPQQPQMLAKSSFTNIRFPWEKKRHRDRPGSGLTAHINVCVCFVYLLCNDRWCCDRGGRTKCAELPGSVRLFR